MRPWLPSRLERLDEIAGLEGNWDSYHALPISPEAIDTGRRVLAVIAMLTEISPNLAAQVVPTVDGGVQMEWHEGGWNAEISIEPDGKLDVWARNKERGIEFSYPADEETR